MKSRRCLWSLDSDLGIKPMHHVGTIDSVILLSVQLSKQTLKYSNLQGHTVINHCARQKRNKKKCGHYRFQYIILMTLKLCPGSYYQERGTRHEHLIYRKSRLKRLLRKILTLPDASQSYLQAVLKTNKPNTESIRPTVYH